MPPPGLNLPPPPGLAQPAQPAIPDAAQDPFGAMNAMAAVGTVQRAPEIVIVNDGRPVENVGASSSGATIAKILIPALIALGIGVAIGKIGQSASTYNAGLKDAKAILGDAKSPSTVGAVKKALSDLDTELDDWKTKSSYKPNQANDKALGEIATRLAVQADKVFRTTASLDPEVAGLIMSFYAGVGEVKGALDAHVKAAKSDDMALSTAKQKVDDAQAKEDGKDANAALASIGAIKYGALITAPTETEHSDFGVKLVELGPPYCGGAQPVTSGKCENNEAPTAYAYRSEPGAVWTKGDLVTSGSDNVPTKKIVLLVPSGVRDALIKTGEPGASEVFYIKRLKAISERVKKLIEEGNKLEQRLQTESSKGSRFSFFM